jgi:hypothetical protein
VLVREEGGTHDKTGERFCEDKQERVHPANTAQGDRLVEGGIVPAAVGGAGPTAGFRNPWPDPWPTADKDTNLEKPLANETESH